VRRKTCSACGYGELVQFLDLGVSPVADAYTATPGEPVERYPLRVAVCVQCYLAQLLDVVDAKVLFRTGYSFYSSASWPLSSYHRAYAADLLARYGDLASEGVVEAGCNDGDFLRHFPGLPTLGVDPAAGPVAAARERGLTVLEEPFGLEVASRVLAERGPAGLVVANHVLAHVEDVSDFLAGVRKLMGPDSVASVEVQYLPDLLVNNAFDLVYHEHRNFFSLASLAAAAGRHGLHVASARLTTRQGGSLRVELTRRPYPPTPEVERLRYSEMWLGSIGAYEGVQGRAERVRERLLDLLQGLVTEGLTVAGYGAPAKATTLLSFCGITEAMVQWVVDTTPAKQGKYIPGTGIPIRAPHPRHHYGANVYLLLAWNYATEIIRDNLSYMEGGGRWVIPLPAPVPL
jgi:C-methyltransferase C-terminal domain/Putative zinc binding domain/Methyltransferase domain